MTCFISLGSKKTPLPISRVKKAPISQNALYGQYYGILVPAWWVSNCLTCHATRMLRQWSMPHCESKIPHSTRTFQCSPWSMESPGWFNDFLFRVCRNICKLSMYFKFIHRKRHFIDTSVLKNFPHKIYLSDRICLCMVPYCFLFWS